MFNLDSRSDSAYTSSQNGMHKWFVLFSVLSLQVWGFSLQGNECNTSWCLRVRLTSPSPGAQVCYCLINYRGRDSCFSCGLDPLCLLSLPLPLLLSATIRCQVLPRIVRFTTRQSWQDVDLGTTRDHGRPLTFERSGCILVICLEPRYIYINALIICLVATKGAAEQEKHITRRPFCFS